MLRPALLSLLLACALPAAFAADKAADKPAELPPVKPGWTLLPDEVPDGKYERLVNEDDNVKVVEIRERGQVKKVTVQLKNSALPDYEILVRGSKSLPLNRQNSGRPADDGPTGVRVWSVADF